MKNNLVGTWKLLGCETRLSNGHTLYPLGQEPKGYLLYTEKGHMSVAIMKAERNPFQANDIAAGTPEEKIAAADSYISYSGTYQVQEDKVVHQVEVSFFPNWVGSNQERFFELTENKLNLKTPPLQVNGLEVTGCLLWEKVA